MRPDEELSRQYIKILDELKSPKLPYEYRELLKRELAACRTKLRDAVCQAIDPPDDRPFWKFVLFAEKLKERQATKIPDFDALYRAKAELDRWLLGFDRDTTA